jgi:hypothetical protein
MTMPIIVTELYDALRELGSTDEKARAAAVVRNTHLQTSIDQRLAHLEKDLKRLKWGVVGVFWLMAVMGAVAAVFLFGENLFKGVAWLPNL